MAWPFNFSIRPYIRMAGYWLGIGSTVDQILDWATGSRDYYDLNYMREAIPEAKRADYFAARIATANVDMPLSQLWGLSARGAWYAGYGRAPTAAERGWAYSRPEGMLGLALEVKGLGLHSGTPRVYTITANVPWSATFGAIEGYIQQCIADGSCITGDMGSEPLDTDTIEILIQGGALLQRQSPTVTMP